MTEQLLPGWINESNCICVKRPIDRVQNRELSEGLYREKKHASDDHEAQELEDRISIAITESGRKKPSFGRSTHHAGGTTSTKCTTRTYK